MKIPNLENHHDKVANLKKKLNDMASSFPFEEAAGLADRVVQKWLVELPRRFRKESDAGGTYNWSQEGGWNAVPDHCVRYVMFHYSNDERTLIGLGPKRNINNRIPSTLGYYVRPERLPINSLPTTPQIGHLAHLAIKSRIALKRGVDIAIGYARIFVTCS